MDFDPNKFIPDNVVDTCAIQNLLSSDTLANTAFTTRFTACITATVEYECLVKPHQGTAAHIQIQGRLRDRIAARQVGVHRVDLADLQDVEILAQRKRVGIGELSCIAFARKVSISVMTDDKKGTKFARAVLGAENRGQGTPRLLGWLLYNEHLQNACVDAVVTEHEAMLGTMGRWFREMRMWIGHCRAMSTGGGSPPRRTGGGG